MHLKKTGLIQKFWKNRHLNLYPFLKEILAPQLSTSPENIVLKIVQLVTYENITCFLLRI